MRANLEGFFFPRSASISDDRSQKLTNSLCHGVPSCAIPCKTITSKSPVFFPLARPHARTPARAHAHAHAPMHTNRPLQGFFPGARCEFRQGHLGAFVFSTDALIVPHQINARLSQQRQQSQSAAQHRSAQEPAPRLLKLWASRHGRSQTSPFFNLKRRT